MQRERERLQGVIRDRREAIRKVWAEAEEDANKEYIGSLILKAGETVGFATSVQRIVTHKVGHRSDRTTSHTGTSTGTAQHRSSGAAGSQGVGYWGIRQGSSVSSSSGVGQHASQHASSGASHAYSQDDVKTEIVDQGQLVLTNQRVVFQGDNATIEIPMDKVIGFHFKDDTALIIDYAKRPAGECYIVPNALAMKIAMSTRLHEPGFEVPPPAR